MAFQNTSQIQVVVCPACQGKGCMECANFGVYGLGQDKTLVFGLPGFIDIAKRRQVKLTFLVKRAGLFLALVLIIVLMWSFINGI